MHLCHFIIKSDNTHKGVRLVKTGAKYMHKIYTFILQYSMKFYGKDNYAEFFF